MSPLPQQSRAFPWVLAAGFTSLTLGAIALAVLGAGNKGTVAGLQLTARCSFCFFLLAYTGGALVTLFGPTFLGLARRGRSFGLAFASAHAPHLCLVAWLYYISPRPPIPTSAAIYFGIGALLVYALAIFSFPRWVALLSPRAWWSLRTLGMDYIAIAFLRDFSGDPFTRGFEHIAAYLPFITLSVLALTLRLSSYGVRVHRRWLTAQAAA